METVRVECQCGDDIVVEGRFIESGEVNVLEECECGRQYAITVSEI
jgi:hypothetical protein